MALSTQQFTKFHLGEGVVLDSNQNLSLCHILALSLGGQNTSTNCMYGTLLFNGGVHNFIETAIRRINAFLSLQSLRIKIKYVIYVDYLQLKDSTDKLFYLSFIPNKVVIILF